MAALATELVLEALSSDAPLGQRLQEAPARVQETQGDERSGALVESAMLAALSGRRSEAEAALQRARADVSGPARGRLELASAAVLLEAGHPARAAGALERADACGGLSDRGDLALSQTFHAQTLLLSDAVSGASDAARAAVEALPESRLGEPLGVYVLLNAAEIALAGRDAASARGLLERTSGAPGRSGILAARADLLEALSIISPLDKLGVSGSVHPQPVEGPAPTAAPPPPDLASAQAAVDRAIARLERLEAPRELGLAYLARASATPESAPEPPASWLARAQPLLARAGTPRDLQRLRRAFRTHGRREIDRVVDADIFGAMEGLRERQGRLRDVLSAERDARTQRAGVWQLPTDKLIDESMEVVRLAEEELISLLERAVIERERIGQLVSVSQEVAAIDRVDELIETIPRLAMALCPADVVELLEVSGEGSVNLLSRSGEALGRPRASLARPAAAALRAGAPQLLDAEPSREWMRVSPGQTSGRFAVVPLRRADRDLALVVERKHARGSIGERELELLGLFGSLAGVSYARARASEALRETAARDAATLSAIRDGVIAVDVEGLVTAVNDAAERMLKLTRAAAIGQRLRSLPGLAPLFAALKGGRAASGEVVVLSQGDFLVRVQPFQGGAVATLQELATAQRLAQKIVGPAARFNFDELVGRDPAFEHCLAEARRAAASDLPILITGESGTGKEMLAQAIHNASPHASSPFVGINVAAIPRELLESELFGYERGAFTGARAGGNAGKFELAEQGTVLLDEIGDMPLEMQAKLLRVLQERMVQRLGGAQNIPIRARVVATTHRDLERAVQEGSFRLDLFHRLRVVHLRLPPLRERKGDVPLLVEHHLQRCVERLGRRPIRVAPGVLAALERYAWPGNVRELANLMEAESSLLPTQTDLLDRVPASVARALVQPSLEPAESPAEKGPVVPLVEVERAVFQRALQQFEGNVARAAKALGVAKGTFYNKIRAYQLAPLPPRRRS